MELKKSLEGLKPYTPNKETPAIKLDANEANYQLYNMSSSFPPLNRYPDNTANDLTNTIANAYNQSLDEVLIGSGSSELLELVVKSFLNPSEVVLSIRPSFVMYQKYTKYYNGTFKTVPVNDNQDVDIPTLLKKIEILQPKIIFLCTPNNPTGKSIKKTDIIKVLTKANGLVVVDEAYIEFADEQNSMISLINEYSNLLVTRTFSKAYGLSALRVGYLLANKDLINQLKKVKTPYSVSSISLQIAQEAFNRPTPHRAYVEMIKKNKAILFEALKEGDITPYDGDGNFIYFKAPFNIDEPLKQKGVVIRSFNNGFYRITIPSNDELQLVLSAIKECIYENNN